MEADLLQVGRGFSFALSHVHSLFQDLAASLRLLGRSGMRTGLLEGLPSCLLLLLRPALRPCCFFTLLLHANEPCQTSQGLPCMRLPHHQPEGIVTNVVVCDQSW